MSRPASTLASAIQSVQFERLNHPLAAIEANSAGGMTAPRQDQRYGGAGEEQNRKRPVPFHRSLQIGHVEAVAGNAVDVQDHEQRQAGPSGKVRASERDLVEIPEKQFDQEYHSDELNRQVLQNDRPVPGSYFQGQR